ncbi:MAG: L,D-transpeptidase [Candidatus Omnitrophica bacterium]|nr:L,D-transpeptidase [Candidatus Omnitrophota bacterium]
MKDFLSLRMLVIGGYLIGYLSFPTIGLATPEGKVEAYKVHGKTDSSLVIHVDRAGNRLFVLSDNKVIKEYPVSTGKKETQTPLGKFTIYFRGATSNRWFPNAEKTLGPRWIEFLETGHQKYGIHGTDAPGLIGQSVSRGCVRMKNKDVEELYNMISVGTKVIITDGH